MTYNIRKKISQYKIQIISVASIIIVFLIIGFSGGLSNLGNLFQNSAYKNVGQKAIDYINQKLLNGTETASLINVQEESGLLKLQIKINNNEIVTYATEDGKLFFPQAYDLTKKIVINKK